MSAVRITLLLLLLSLAACGQKGPLTLPEDTEAVPPQATETTEAEAEEEEEEDEEADPR